MKFLILTLFLSSMALAEHYKIGGELMEFKDKDGLELNGCEKDCLALKAVAKHKKIDLKKVRKKEKVLGSVGSDVCRLVYQANSLIGVNKEQDQRAFCVFKDNSQIEINSLSRYLVDKKIVVD